MIRLKTEFHVSCTAYNQGHVKPIRDESILRGVLTPVYTPLQHTTDLNYFDTHIK